MELNLRKARKLEAKIADVIAKVAPASTIKVRVLSTEEQRNQDLETGRTEFLESVENRDRLTQARFWIRKEIGRVNASLGINDLIAFREEVQAYLTNSVANSKMLDLDEVNDLASTKKAKLEKGESSRYGDDGVSFESHVLLAKDIESFKKRDVSLRKELEETEDELAQKNLGAKITLPAKVVELLKKNDLL